MAGQPIPLAGGRRLRLGLGFALAGAVTTLLGPLLPWLSGRWGLQSGGAGGFFLAQFLAAMAGTLWASGRTGKGFRHLARGGYWLIALGLGLLPLGPPALGYAAVAIYGFGLGLVIPALNLQTAERQGDGAAAALNWLNFAWGAGAVASPLWMAAIWRTGRPALGLELLAALAGAAAVGGLPADAGLVRQSARAARGRVAAAPRWAAAGAFALAVFLYVALENCLGGWAAMLGRSEGWAAMAAVLLPAVFWAGLLAGRALAPTLLRHIAERRLAYGGLLLAAIGCAVLLLALGPWLWLGLGLAGLGCAAQFPLLIAAASRRLGPRAAASVWIFACGGLGGAVGPWLMGQWAQLASLRAALGLPLLLTAILAAVYGPVFAGRGPRRGAWRAVRRALTGAAS